MDAEIEIGRVTAAELDVIRKLASRRLKEEYSQGLFQHFLENFPGCFLAAREEGEVVGFILAVPRDERTLRILMLAVAASRTGMGIGTLLVSSAEKYASTRKMTSLVLEVGILNDGAIGFYTMRGFNITGIIKGYYNDGSDAFMMKKFHPM